MMLHFEMFRFAKFVNTLSLSTSLMAATIIIRYIQRSIHKPTLILPPPLSEPDSPTSSTAASTVASTVASIVKKCPTLHKPWFPHPLTSFFPPLIRGLATTGFIGMYMSSITLYPLVLLKGVLGFHDPFHVERVDVPTIRGRNNTVQPPGIVSLVWSDPPEALHEPIVLLLPGMNNNSETGFVRRLAKRLMKGTEAKVATLDYRHIGHSISFGSQSARPTCADNYRDLPYVIDYIHDKYSPSSLIVIGQSIGGGMGLKHVGMEPDTKVSAFIAVSPPVDYGLIAKKLESNPLSRLANFFLCLPPKYITLVTPVVRRQMTWKNIILMCLSPTLRMFEEAMLIPICPEYTSSWDFYDQNNPTTSLHAIKVPTLIISSVDDPLCSPPTRAGNDVGTGNVAVCTVEYGGHLGFFLFDIWCSSWADKVCEEYCSEVIRREGEEERRKEKMLVDKKKGGRIVKRKGSWRGAIVGF